MDSQDHQQNKNGSSGQENHVCHRCGWPFPNPHPSAKHRRAHKKVCGTLEGYKLVKSDADHPHLSVSDDEHASDDDHHTPSPKIVKRGVKVLDSDSGGGDTSNKSGDDLFPDAVMESTDKMVSPGIEDPIRGLNKDVEKLVTTDLNGSQLLKVDITADTSALPKDPTWSSQTWKAGVTDGVKDETAKSLNDTGNEKSSVESSGIIGKQFGSYPVKFGTPTDRPIKEIDTDVNQRTQKEASINGTADTEEDRGLTDFINPHGKDVRQLAKQECNLEEIGKQPTYDLAQGSVIPEADQEKGSESEGTKGKSLDLMTPEKVVHEPLITDYKLQMGQGQTSDLSTDGISEQMKDENDKVEANAVKNANVAKNDVSPLVKPPEHVADSVTVLPHVADDSGRCEIIRVCGWGDEGKEEMQASSLKNEQEETRVADVKECGPSEAQMGMYSFSVPQSAPVIDNVEHMIEDFKDYNVIKSNLPQDLGSGSAEVISLKQDNDKTAIAKEANSGLHLAGLSSSIESSCADSNALQHEFDEKITEKHAERNSEPIEESGDDHSSCALETSSDALKTEAQNIQSYIISEGSHLHPIDSEPSQKAHTEDDTLDQSDTKSGAFGEEIVQANNSIESENADNNELDRSPLSVAAIRDSSREPWETGLSAESKTILKHGDISFVPENDQTEGSLKVEQNQHHGSTTVELMDTSRCESTKVGDGEILLKNTEAAHESIGQMQKSTTSDMVLDEVIDATGNMERPYSRLDRCEDESSQEAPQRFGSGNVTANSVGSASKDIEVNHNSILLATDENPEDSIIKEVVPLLVDNEIPNENSSTVEVNPTTEAVKSSSDCGSEPSRDEVGNKFENQYDGASVVDISVASNSRADSLEGHWGSVSVVSSQSDSTATTDAGGLSFADSQPPERSEAYLQMPKHATDKFHPEKSDIFELPSFMTLVESGNGASEEVAPSEVLTVQSNKQQKPEDLRAGWFPSLSNVANESQGRKKNEEIIAKVSNWSTGKQHGPLKSLLAEAKSPNLKQVPTETRSVETATKSNDTDETTVNSILESEAPNDQTTNKEMEKEWNSPARYPSEIKKEKRKGKPYWVPFVCCSSMHRDL